MEGYLAEIRMFAGNFAPLGWAFCQNQTIAIAQNTALFALLGTSYGGNGQTTFNLPDFRGRVAVGTGQGPGLPSVDLGEMAGTNTETLLTTQIPMHNHILTGTLTMQAAGDGALSTDASGRRVGPGSFYSASSADLVNMAPLAGTQTIGSSGGSQPHNNMQPYLAVNFIICMEGIFPSRN